LNSPAESISWPSRSGFTPLALNEIHIWATTLDVPPATLEIFSATLSPDELERANRFKSGKLRDRFIAGRGALRAILAPYLGQSAAALRFTYSDHGKPTLAEEFAGANLHLNLAHTGDLALIAVTNVGDVGVDIESIRPIKNVDDLVARFFSARENELFQQVPAAEKPAAFFNLWTRKEALLKATGEGLTGSLSLMEVSFLPGEPARLLAISGNRQMGTRWILRELSPAPGFTGAVAVEGGTINGRPRTPDEDAAVVVKCWKWNPDFA